MTSFKQKKILSVSAELVKFLKENREKKGLSLAKAAVLTGINPKYLEAIENGDFSALPEGLYARNYVRQYAVFLGINDDALLQDFRLEKIDPGEFSKKELFARKAPSWRLFLALPHSIRSALIVLSVLLCLSYVGYSVFNIVSPPKMLIIKPASDETVFSAEYMIQGQTETEAEIRINDELVLADPQGFFAKKVNLQPGVNIITIVSQKKYGKKSQVERRIILE